MMMTLTTSRRIRIQVGVLLLSVLAFDSSTTIRPAAAQPFTRWEFGPRREFTPPTTRGASGVTAPSTSPPPVKLSRVAVQRPLIAPGETANLIAEYDISVPQEKVEVKETRIIRFEGQQVATLEKIVSVSRGASGSTVPVKVPLDAAAGLYTITTVVELQSAARTRGAPPESVGDRANSVFRVEARAATPASPPAVAAPPKSDAAEL